MTQWNHVPVPYSWPGAAVVGHTNTVSASGTAANRTIPHQSFTRPSSLNAMSANKTNSQIAQ